MIPDPLHPAIVHFPIVLMVLLPLAALVALWAIRRGAAARAVWAVPVALALLLAVSAWAAVETGEAQEERVEGVVSEEVLHAHEEGAERFLVLSGVLVLVASAGLAGGTLGRAGRILTTAGAFALAVVGADVGAEGGELVYRHNAGRAYADVATVGGVPAAAAEREDDD